jgi:hypothetical protein
MHKTKVAAFMAANALSGAGWDYDMTGSPDGNYHCLDAVGNNYVTCFKRVVDSSTMHYFAILTLTKYGGTSWTTTGYVQISNSMFARATEGAPSSTNYYLGAYYASSFIRYGVTQFSYLSILSQNEAGQSYVLPSANPGMPTSWTITGSCDGSETMFAVSTNYYGYAIKGSSIIMFGGPSMSGVAVSMLSFDAFSSKFVETTNALADTLFINTQGVSSSSQEKNNAYHNYSSSVVVATRANSAKNRSDSFSFVTGDPLAYYAGNSIQAYPFQAVSVKNYSTDSSGTIARGTVQIDLFAINYPTVLPTKFSTVANGSLLVLDGSSESTNTPQMVLGQWYAPGDHAIYIIGMYCGWDPSNPDITQASAWTEYEGT